jgi:protoporphyrinogen oxidase
MKIGILGGGITGLTTAHMLAKNHTVEVIEASDRVGGLAQGFKKDGWDWYLDNTYHHIFSNDSDILTLASEVGSDFRFSQPSTKTIFGSQNNYRIFPVDSPKDILLLPELSLLSRLRMSAVAALFKITPFLSVYEQNEASLFLRKTMGEEAWNTMWGPLFRKKFGKYAEKIVTSFIWARINKRTRSLGYPNGGFQTFVDNLKDTLIREGVQIKTGARITTISKQNDGFVVEGEESSKNTFSLRYDRVVSTLPFPIFLKIADGLLPRSYTEQQSKRKYLWAVNLIVEMDKKIMKDTYWLNVNAQDIPVMCIVQHTNFVDKKHYGNREIVYFAWYVEKTDPLMEMSGEDILKKVMPTIEMLTQGDAGQMKILQCTKAPFAQPIFDAEFTRLDRSIQTPIPSLFNGNLDFTYPFDRGTNYAVELGMRVSNLVK